MENETEKIFKAQLRKLPSVVVDFISSTNWEVDLDEIGSLYNLPEKDVARFKREVTFVLLGLVHPNALAETLSQEVGFRGEILEALVANIENKILAPVRPALLEFFENEYPAKTGQSATKSPVQKEWGRMPDVAPDNLPTGEGAEPLLPPIPQKVSSETPPNWDITPTHPFEEKMKKVFTAGQQSMGDLTLEPARQNFPQETLSGPATPNISHDPYREPVE